MVRIIMHPEQETAYDFETIDEAIDFLVDQNEPTDSELLDLLDDAAEYGFRQCLDVGVCPSSENMNNSCTAEMRCAGQPIRELLHRMLQDIYEGKTND
jgi:hypothetical protein